MEEPTLMNITPFKMRKMVQSKRIWEDLKLKAGPKETKEKEIPFIHSHLNYLRK